VGSTINYLLKAHFYRLTFRHLQPTECHAIIRINWQHSCSPSCFPAKQIRLQTECIATGQCDWNEGKVTRHRVLGLGGEGRRQEYKKTRYRGSEPSRGRGLSHRAASEARPHLTADSPYGRAVGSLG